RIKGLDSTGEDLLKASKQWVAALVMVEKAIKWKQNCCHRQLGRTTRDSRTEEQIDFC
ncbi:hypothetical protein MKW98_003826, partial [Papaver atlanticum]